MEATGSREFNVAWVEKLIADNTTLFDAIHLAATEIDEHRAGNKIDLDKLLHGLRDVMKQVTSRAPVKEKGAAEPPG
jgi:hypothetical protein